MCGNGGGRDGSGSSDGGEDVVARVVVVVVIVRPIVLFQDTFWGRARISRKWQTAVAGPAAPAPAWAPTTELGRVAGDVHNVSPDGAGSWLTRRVGQPVHRGNERQRCIPLLWGNTRVLELAHIWCRYRQLMTAPHCPALHDLHDQVTAVAAGVALMDVVLVDVVVVVLVQVHRFAIYGRGRRDHNPSNR